jgi:membrane protein
MADKWSRVKWVWQEAQGLWTERTLTSQATLTEAHKFVIFWLLAGRSFVRNRCPVRAASLAYATLLALIPMLAVVVSITSTFLKQQGEDRIQQFIVKLVASVTPPAMLSTNTVIVSNNLSLLVTNAPGSNVFAESAELTATNLALLNRSGVITNEVVVPNFMKGGDALQARDIIARNIHEFIKNTRSGTLGFTGTILLIFVGISMLSRVEETFNDMWGVVRGRSWSRRIVLYWSVITLAPMLLVVALGLASGPHFEATRKLVGAMPYIGSFLFHLLPVLVLCLTFGLIYALMPNTRVDWRAATVGGLAGGILFHLNNMASVLYVSRVVSNSSVYGSLGLVPVFMIGLYFSWLILLFGGQVSYAYQNRAIYLEEKQSENINQRGREFVAFRLITLVGQKFVRGEPSPSVALLGRTLGIPTRLIQQVMQTLTAARLVVETAGLETAYTPARPIEQITCYDVLLAMRACQGRELATRDEPTRSEIIGEFQRIQEAERLAASAVTLLALVQRAEARLLSGESRVLEPVEVSP